jgi:hypothetical protein
VDLAAVAAFTAAALSLVNVAISARLVSRGQREQWRRDQERPVVARCLTLSDDARREWWPASVAKQDASADARPTLVDAHWEKGWQLLHDLRYEVAQLDLLASRAVRQAARDLAAAHEQEASRLVLTAEPGQDDYEGRQAAKDKIEELQSALTEKTRADLGLGVRVPPGSLLGQMLARRLPVTAEPVRSQEPAGARIGGSRARRPRHQDS